MAIDVIAPTLVGALIVLIGAWVRRNFASFLSQSPSDYAAASQDQQMDIRRDLNGEIICEGVIYGPTGRVSSRFVGHFNAEWVGNTCVMKEHFEYDSGASQDREWTLVLGNDGGIRATAPDVIGEGSGKQAGSAVQLKYRIQLPDSAGGHVLDTVDWMYRGPNGTIVNRSQFRKFGIQVAELVATMRRKEPA